MSARLLRSLNREVRKSVESRRKAPANNGRSQKVDFLVAYDVSERLLWGSPGIAPEEVRL